MKKVSYEEGDIFAVPLQIGGFALGLVARKPKSNGVPLGYFWGPVQSAIPMPSELPNLSPDSALLVKKFSDLKLINGSWPIVAPSGQWNNAQWPVPKFIRKSALSKRAWLVTYLDSNPNQVAGEESCAYDIAGYELDGLAGAGAIEALLSHRLKK